jgi:hypothetical protein
MHSYVYLSSKNANTAYLQKRIEQELSKHGYNSLGSDYLPGLEISDELGRWIRATDLIIADISDNRSE